MVNLLLQTTKTMVTVAAAAAAATVAMAAATLTHSDSNNLVAAGTFINNPSYESTNFNSALNAATTTRKTSTNVRTPVFPAHHDDAWSPWESGALTASAVTYRNGRADDKVKGGLLLTDSSDGDNDDRGAGRGGEGGGEKMYRKGKSGSVRDGGSSGRAVSFSINNFSPLSLLLNATTALIYATNSTATTLQTPMPTPTLPPLLPTINASNVSSSTALEGIGATETPYVPYVMRPETYIVPVLFAFIFIVGVLGNGTLIVVFLGVRQMRNVPNTYILSLALADLLVIVTTVPLTSTVYTVDSWPWGSFLCTLSEFIKDVSIGVSVFTLTALSGDRYFAIVDPLRKFHAHGGGKRATRMTIAIAFSIWILAIICGMPALLGTNVKNVKINNNKSFHLCYPFPDQWGYEYAKTMVLLRFLVYYAIPLIIIGVFYVLIARHLMYSANVPGEMQGAVRQVRARRKVAVTVLAFVVIFGICFLPYHVFMLWFYYWPTAQQDYNSFWHVLRILGFCLSFANSCANPVALYFVSGAFRKHFNRYLFCQGSGVRHKKRHNGDTLCMHRDTSLTSTASKRYASRRSFQNQSTIRSCRLQETTITTMLPNGNHNGEGSDLALTSDYYQSAQREQMRLM